MATNTPDGIPCEFKEFTQSDFTIQGILFKGILEPPLLYMWCGQLSDLPFYVPPLCS